MTLRQGSPVSRLTPRLQRALVGLRSGATLFFMNPRLTLLLAGLATFLSPQAGAAGLWDTRPLKIIQSEEMNFPAALATQGVREGEVRAVIHVDSDGKLVDCLITAYTHRELAQEVVAGLRGWTYEPAQQRGERIGSRLEVAFAFEAKGNVVSLTSIETNTGPINRLLGTPPTFLLCRATELDRPLAATHAVPPGHPGRALKPAQPQGSVTIDFYIDATGRARMPVPTQASHELFAAAAVEALLQWQFTPPTRNGAPVVVRVVQRFDFKPGPT